MTVGKARQWLVKYRGKRTHQQVAEMAGISRSYYTELEMGDKNPSVDVAKKIGIVLGFNWTIFFKERSRKTQQPTGTDQ